MIIRLLEHWLLAAQPPAPTVKRKQHRKAKKAIQLASLHIFLCFHIVIREIPPISEMVFELQLSKVQSQERQAPVWIRKLMAAWLCPASMLWWGWVVSDLYDCCLSTLKSENLAIILPSVFPRGHLNPSGHHWDLFWEAFFASGLRNATVILSLQR